MYQIQETISDTRYPKANAVLRGYLNENSDRIDPYRKHPAVLILPGGGYEHVSPRESTPVALQFLAAGAQAFTLNYSVAPDAFWPQSLIEALLAIRHIRAHAKEYRIQPDHLSVCGFSAGGHLALCTAALWQDPEIRSLVSCPEELTGPDKLILSYPVVTGGSFAHAPSFHQLAGKEDPALRERLSMERLVTDQFPPVFLWHTFSDATVPVQNSLLLAMALAEHHIPLELHIYPEGVHGLSLGNFLTNGGMIYGQDHPCSEWIGKAIQFLYT